jgi:adenylosuccinate lyase
MDISSLKAVSPVDGRYSSQTEILAAYFSEFALIRYRLLVEIEYFISLTEIPLPQLVDYDKKFNEELRDIYLGFEIEDAEAVKDFEKTTNHDVKAVEYFIRKKFDEIGLGQFKEFIHFGLTSQDINNTAIPLSLKDAHNEVINPLISDIIIKLEEKAAEWKDIPMLARTHGQPASPTKLGKEIMVFAERLSSQLELIANIPFCAKFGGATGNFNAHHVAYPHIDWVAFSNFFISNKVGLQRLQHTTQIEHYDNLAAYFDAIKRINTILTDFDRDIWQYISMDYFKQKLKAGEVGSSAMPHKVNPIDFENSEGNLGMANAILAHLSAKLPISRLQRDLTDSTVTRNIGVAMAYCVIAYNSLLKGINKLLLNEAKMNEDLEDNWAVVAEAIQTILRRENYPDPYNALKELTRTNQKITKPSIHQFIDGLAISNTVKAELKKITPENYTGITQ